MKTLPLLALTGCFTQVDLPDTLKEQCAPEIERLEASCDAWNGTFAKEVDGARICLGNEVRILCQNPGYGEPKILTIEKR